MDLANKYGIFPHCVFKKEPHLYSNSEICFQNSSRTGGSEEMLSNNYYSSIFIWTQLGLTGMYCYCF